MFDADNIKNMSEEGGTKSISLNYYWYRAGGPEGLARGLKTSLSVNSLLNFNLLL
jgi:hypothetical protein